MHWEELAFLLAARFLPWALHPLNWYLRLLSSCKPWGKPGLLVRWRDQLHAHSRRKRQVHGQLQVQFPPEGQTLPIMPRWAFLPWTRGRVLPVGQTWPEGRAAVHSCAQSPGEGRAARGPGEEVAPGGPGGREFRERRCSLREQVGEPEGSQHECLAHLLMSWLRFMPECALRSQRCGGHLALGLPVCWRWAGQ